MKADKLTYRGFDIEYDEARGWILKKNEEIVCTVPSRGAALDFVDQEKRKARTI